VGDPNGPASSIAGEGVIAVVGTALAGLPPVPPNAGSRGAEYRDDVDSLVEAREPGRSGEDGCGRPGIEVAGNEAAGKGGTAGGGGDGVRVGEGTGEV